MATYVIAPGAWLAGSTLHPHAGNKALHPHAAGNSPLHPHAAGNSPLHPHLTGQESRLGQLGAAEHPHVLPPSVGSAVHGQALLAAGQPWRGTDPGWVYQGGPQALLAQALERTHSRIVRPADPRLAPRAKGARRVVINAAHAADPLWRWGGEFRVQAVLADLAWRLRADGSVLRLTKGGAASLDLRGCAALSNAFFENQIDKVQRAAIEREDRLPEILAQSDDLWSFFRVVLGLDVAASPILAEVMAVAWQWATPLVMALKNDVAAWRPVQRAPTVLPVIPTPAHGALPSGHATMAALTAEVLSQLLFGGDQKHPRVQQLDRLARRIAFNRVVAGVHFPVDSAAGYALGLQLAGHFVGWANNHGAYPPFKLVPAKFFQLTETGARPPLLPVPKSGGQSAPLALLWDAARREAQRGVK